MEKYSWNFNGDAENWGNDTHDTIDRCLADAREAVADGNYQEDETPTVVYIGQNEPFAPWVDAEMVLEALQEQAGDFAGEVGGDWDAYDCKKTDELNELSETLTAAVDAWMEKYGYTPHFWAINRIKEYLL